MGRLTEFNDKIPETAYKLALLGATDKDMAEVFGVSEQTFNNWKGKFPSLVESLKEGKSIADANVGKRLYERAMGYEHDEEEIKVVDKEIVRVPVRKYYAPDTTAAIFWLKNREPGKWRDRQELQIDSKVVMFGDEPGKDCAK